MDRPCTADSAAGPPPVDRPGHRARLARAMAAACVIGLAAAGCAADREGPPGTFTLVLGDSFPTTHPFSRDGARFFIDRVGELTGGRVRFEYYPSEQLGAAQDFVNLARSGVVDVAMVSPGYVAAQLPLSGVADLPGMSSTACHGALALEPLLAEGGVLHEADFAPDGLRPLVVGVIPGYEVMSGGGRVVTDPSDVAGLQLRSSGGAIDRTVTLLGAAPVAMPVTEMYEAISRGTVDGTVLGPTSALPYRLDEAATNSTLGAQLGSFTITYSIGRRIWDELPPELKDAVARAGRDTTRHLCRAIDAHDAESREKLAAGGLAFHPLTAEERRRWQQAVEPAREQWVADMEQLGLPGRAALDAMLTSLRALPGDVR
jgi:TRAP-type C4-dicarboxylate transport system substrate-binding protein